MEFYENYMNGYIALMTILIISAIILTIAVSASLLSISQLDISLIQEQSAISFYLASACAEQALMNLKTNPDYQGNEILSFGNYHCKIHKIKNNIIKASADISGQVRKIQIDTQIDSWQEVADF